MGYEVLMVLPQAVEAGGGKGWGVGIGDADIATIALNGGTGKLVPRAGERSRGVKDRVVAAGEGAEPKDGIGARGFQWR